METRQEGFADLGAVPTMELEVHRNRNNGDTTIGQFFIDGKLECDTLEDEPRLVKVKHETRIPAGRYEVTFRTVGGFHGKYQSYYTKKFNKDWHKGMLWVRNVPEFEYILIHCGNDDEDTSGCLLLGTAPNEKAYVIGSSRKAYEKAYPVIRDHLLKGGKVFITYYDNDTKELA